MRGTRASASYARGLATYSSPAGMRGSSTAVAPLAASRELSDPATAPVAGKLLGTGWWRSLPAAAVLGSAAVGTDAVLGNGGVGPLAALRPVTLSASTAGDTWANADVP